MSCRCLVCGSIWLRIKNKNYWKTARVERKNKFNCTNLVDGVLYIHSEAETICNKSDTCRESKCEHIHIIRSADVSIAIKKLKSDKVNDNGWVYSNNFKHGTELLFQYLSMLFTSMVHHGFCPSTFICANIIPIPKGSKANLSDSDKYRSIAISSILGKILDHIIIVKQSEALKTSNYLFGFKANSSTVLCSTMVNETVQYYMKMVQNQFMFYYLMPPKPSIKLHLMFYSMNCVVVLCVPRLQSYYTTCIQIKSVV